MRRDLVLVGLLLVGLGVIVGVLRVLDVLGGETVRTLALVVILGAVAVGLVLAGGWSGARILTAANSGRQAPAEKITVIRETRVLDGRQQAPVLYQLPAPQSQAFPDLLRAAYTAGRLELPAAAAGADQDPEDWDGEIGE